MHFIQKHILRELSQHPSLRYSQLQLRRVETNKFTYHLRKLMRDNLVKKVPDGYALTTKGVHYCTRVNFDEYTVRIQPKIVTLVVCKNKNREYLMYRRTKRPFLGMIGFPYGKIHLGESVLTSVEREIVEKTGVTCPLSQKGIVYLLVSDAHGDVIEHMVCHVFYGDKPVGEALPHTKFGSIHWMSKKEIEEGPPMPGVLEILKIATSKKNGLQFAEYTFEHAV